MTTDFCTLCKKVSRFSVEKFLSQSAEKFPRGTFLCFRNTLVSNNVRDKRGGGYHDFSSKLFCLTVPKIFVGEPFGVSENFWYRKILCFRGLCQDIPWKIFCLTVPKHFVEEPFGTVFQKNSGGEKVYVWVGGGKEGVSRFSVENFLSYSAEKFHSWNLLRCVSENFRLRKSLWIRGEGESQDFPSKILCLTVPKISVGASFTVALISGTEKVYG